MSSITEKVKRKDEGTRKGKRIVQPLFTRVVLGREKGSSTLAVGNRPLSPVRKGKFVHPGHREPVGAAREKEGP